MIEATVFLTLLGIGLLASQEKKKQKNSRIDSFNSGSDDPSQEDPHKSVYYDKAREMEYLACSKAMKDSMEPRKTGVISRNATSSDFVDPQTVMNEKLAPKNIIEDDKKKGLDASQATYSRLTDSTIENFTHNNMVPFFGSRVKQNMKFDANNTILEKYTGVGPVNENFYLQKKETPVMFKPEKNVGNPYGMRDSDSFIQSRMVQSTVRNNEFPIEKIQVGPGLNQGYGSNPSGGFNQSDTRDYAMPKNVDDLRVLSNPKNTYRGRVISGQKDIKRGKLGEVFKNNPDTFYKNCPDRYFKTTGAYTKDRKREKHILQPQNRQNTHVDYKGPAMYANSKAVKSRPGVKKTNKTQLNNFGFRNVDADEYGKGADYDYGKGNILIYKNERDITTTKTHKNNLTSAVKALSAPLLDVFKFSKKEYTVDNKNQTGNIERGVRKQTIYDPNDVARTTLKEQLIHDASTGTNTPQQPSKLTVYDPEDIARTTMREIIDPMDTELNMKRAAYKQTIYDPEDVAKTTIKEQTIDEKRSGNLNRLEDVGPGAYVSTEYDAKNTHKQFTSDNNYYGSGYVKQKEAFNASEHEVKDTQKQFISDNDYTGIAGPGDNDKAMSYEDMYNACISDVKEMVLEGREPTKSSTKMAQGGDSINIEVLKRERDRESKRLHNNQNKVYQDTPSNSKLNNQCKLTGNKDTLKQNIQLERTESEILNSFNKNPYTQPLDSVF